MSSSNPEPWPIAAASRIRVKVQDDDGGAASYCRLFYNPSSGKIELVPYCNDDNNNGAAPIQQREIYDDSNVNLEDEPDYQSYIASAADTNRIVKDTFHPDYVIGANLSLEYNVNNPNTFHGMESYASSKINIYCYPRSGKYNKREACQRHYTLDSRCCEDFSDARSIIQSIRQLSKLPSPPLNSNKSNNKSRPLKYLVILNPYSGGGGESSKTSAKNVYQNMVKRMLDEAGIEHDALVTRREGHARERMGDVRIKSKEGQLLKIDKNGETESAVDSTTTDSETNDITEYSAIIAMGGDGILFEIFQGIHARSDSDTILSKMKFGIIPCGTFNGLSKSILHWSNVQYDVMESIFHVCKGHTSTLDIATYTLLPDTATATKSLPKSYLSFLSFAWGLIADCDHESECLRWLGAIRSDIWAVYRGLLCRRNYRARFSYLPPNSNKVVMPKLGEPLPDGWVSFEDDFIVFWVCNTSHAAHNMFTCPVAKMNDGLFHVLIVR